MTQFITSGQIGVGLTTVTSATGSSSNEGGLFALGTMVHSNGNKYVYVLSSGAIFQYATVAVDTDNKARPITKARADGGERVAFAQTAIPATSFGWVCYEGNDISVTVKASCGADAPLYTTSSAGVLDDTVTSQTLIRGVVINAAASGSKVARAGQAYAVQADVS